MSKKSCGCKKSCPKKKSCHKKSHYKKSNCCNNPWYTNTPQELEEYDNLNNVNGSTSGTGNVLTNGYGIVYGLRTPNVYNVTTNFF